MKTPNRPLFAWPLVRRISRYLFAAVASTAAGPFAAAADFSIGVGAGIDRGRVDCVGSFPCDRSSTHGKLFFGYQINDAVDVQAVFFDAGRFKGGDTTPLGTEFGASSRSMASASRAATAGRLRRRGAWSHAAGSRRSARASTMPARISEAPARRPSNRWPASASRTRSRRACAWASTAT